MGLGDPTIQKDYFTRLRERLTTGDMIYGLGTMAIAALNPDGVEGQAKVMEDQKELSASLGANLVKSTSSVINKNTLPRLKEIEKEKNELDQWYESSMIDGNGMAVRKPFVKALVESGQWKLFAQALEKEEAALAKATGGDSYKLSAAEIEGMFPEAETILRNYSNQDWETFEETEGKTFRDYLDTQFSGYKEIIAASDNAEQAKTGLFASFYNPTAGALQEQAKLMRVMPPQTVDGTTFTMQQLAELSQAGYLGQNPEDFIPIPGSFDFSRNDPNLFVEKIQSNLHESVTATFTKTIDADASNMFNADGDFTQAGGVWNDKYLPWDGSINALNKTIEIGRRVGSGPQKIAGQAAERLKELYGKNKTFQLLIESNTANFLLDKQVDQNGNRKFTPTKILQLQEKHRQDIIDGVVDADSFTVHEDAIVYNVGTKIDGTNEEMVSFPSLIEQGQTFARSIINNIQQYTTQERSAGIRQDNSELLLQRELPINGKVFASIESVEKFLEVLNIKPDKSSYNGFLPTDTITFLHDASLEGKSILVSATLSQLTSVGRQQFIRRN